MTTEAQARTSKATRRSSPNQVERSATPEQVWVAVARCYRSMSSQIEESFAGSGMSLTDFMILEALLHKGPLTITEVQAAALLATGSMTAAVDRLAARELIVRTASPQDRRARVLQLTPAGTVAITEAYTQHRAQLRLWMSMLSAEERTVTFAALRKVEKHLQHANAASPE